MVRVAGTATTAVTVRAKPFLTDAETASAAVNVLGKPRVTAAATDTTAETVTRNTGT